MSKTGWMHTIIKDPNLNGWEYGMLRSFEKAIQEELSATIQNIPDYPYARKYIHHFGNGMARRKYRRYFPRQSWSLTGDTAWYILMGPENYKLDLYRDWDRSLKTKILYLYDTFPSQYALIKKLLSDRTWDVLITSFNDAVDDLTAITGRQWTCIQQAADRNLFTGARLEEKVIHFSSYGRRYPVLHEVVKEFCAEKGLYYDYTTHDGLHPVVDSSELYKQYAWHLNHSLFTFSWPVEFTNPKRSGHLRPITCRWFEAMAAGTIILGRKPGNEIFENWLDKDLVVDIDPTADKRSLLYKLNEIWDQREQLFEKAQKIRNEKLAGISWNKRVLSITEMLSPVSNGVS